MCSLLTHLSCSDVAQARWTKLVNSRSTPHARLRLPDFKALTDICEAFLELPERHAGAGGKSGGGGGGALRTAVQGQCR